MNILYSVVGRDFHEMIIRKIMNAFNVENQIAITELWDIKNLFTQSYEFLDVYYARYDKYKEDKECEPIDAAVLDVVSDKSLETIRMMDRHYTYSSNFEERLQLYIKHIEFWNYVIDLYKIDCAIFFNIPHEVFDFVIDTLCRVKGIKVLTLFAIPSSIFKNRGLISFDYKNEWKKFSQFLNSGIHINNEGTKAFKHFYESARAENAGSEIGKSKYEKYASMRDNIELDMIYDLRIMVDAQYSDQRLTSDKMREKLSEVYFGEKYKGFRKKLLDKHYKDNDHLLSLYEKLSETPVEGEKYIFYALHYQPEATSSPWGGIYSEQILPIRMLSKYLPDGCMLYVKEHPSQTNIGRDECLYKEISKLSNTRIISMEYDSMELLRNAMATATLTGTIAMESVVNEIPCITFGNYIYNSLEGVKYVASSEDCKKAICEILNGKVKVNVEGINNYFCALYEYTLPINTGYGLYNAEKNADDISKELIRMIKSYI